MPSLRLSIEPFLADLRSLAPPTVSSSTSSSYQQVCQNQHRGVNGRWAFLLMHTVARQNIGLVFARLS